MLVHSLQTPCAQACQMHQMRQDCKHATDMLLAVHVLAVRLQWWECSGSMAQQHRGCADEEAPTVCCVCGPTGSRTRTWTSWARASPASGTWASPSTRSSTSRQAYVLLPRGLRRLSAVSHVEKQAQACCVLRCWQSCVNGIAYQQRKWMVVLDGKVTGTVVQTATANTNAYASSR
jgi:hypothetical protein